MYESIFNRLVTRRTALKTLAAAGAFAAGLRSARPTHADAPPPAAAEPTGPFTLPALPYAYEALEPHIDAETMHLHHDKHHATYVKNLNAALAKHPELASKSIEELLTGLDALPEDIRAAVRNQGGGHYNHSLFWRFMAPGASSAPTGPLADALNKQFGSHAAFIAAFKKAAVGVFGSGWAWLTMSPDGTLAIETTPNQDTPLSAGRTPLLGVDIWEHAYYLKYKNKRADYVDAFVDIINWPFVAERYAAARKA